MRDSRLTEGTRMRSYVMAILSVLGAWVAVASAKPVAQWTFDDGVLTDSVSGLHASFQQGAGVIFLKDGVACFKNQGRSDQEGDVLVVEDAPILTGNENNEMGYKSLVIEADVMPDALGSQMQIVRKTDKDGQGYQLYIRPDGRVAFNIRGNDKQKTVTSKGAVPVDGNWHHIEAVWDESAGVYDMHLTMDRVVSIGSSEVAALTDTEAPLTIGGYCRAKGNYGQRFSGGIDNVAVSVDRPELLDVSGVPLSDPAVMTGAHLTNQPGFVSMQFVYDPPVTPECHAGTLAQNPDGKIVGAWFGGTHEGHVDTGVWSGTFDQGKWSIPREIAHGSYADGTKSTTFNPVLYQYPNGGPMLLFFGGGTLNSWLGYMQTSPDGGASWSPSQRLPGAVHGATKNKPVLLADGTLLCPDNNDGPKFDRTRDYGKTWLESCFAPAGAISAIQPTILIHKDGRLQALSRSKSAAIVETWSKDNGETWSPVEKTALPNNFSGIDAVTLADGRFLLVYNHVGIPDGGWGGPRTPLNIAVSDDGVHWQAALVLEDEPGEFSYPAVIQAADGTVHVLYTWNRIRMKQVEINPDALALRPIVNGQWPEK